ncbi:MAG: hypothetical protein ACK4XJ_05710 [Fimbriimonadaceae bacterium]
MPGKKVQGEGLGPIFGVLMFVGGALLLGVTFKLAFDLFTTDPQRALGANSATEGLDLNAVAGAGYALIGRILLLLVMCAIGSALANRGIRLYSESIRAAKSPPEKETPSD